MLVLSKKERMLCNSALAQGGVAAVVDKENDDFRLHIADTLIAGGYKNDLRSLENAQRILNAAALTPVQKRRQLVLHFRADLRFRSCISQCGLSYFFRDFPERSSVLEKQHLTGFFDG